MTDSVQLSTTPSLYFISLRLYPRESTGKIYLLFPVYCIAYIITLFLIVVIVISIILFANLLQIVMRKYAGYE